MTANRDYPIDPETDGWKIVRSKPIKETPGLAFPIFIDNFNHHLTTIDVYEDGAIDCWGFVDRELFREKVESGWVVSQPPVDSNISIFNLGVADVAAAEWSIRPAMIVEAVESAIQILNPTSQNLLDMEGDSSEMRDGLRYAKLGLADKKPYRLSEENSERILGSELPVFRRTEDGFLFAHLFVYADGLIEVTGDTDLQPIAELSNRFSDGDLSLSVPDGSWISLPPYGKFKTTGGHWNIKAEERLKEAADELEQLRGGDGSIRTCIAAHQAFQENSTEKNKKILKETYEAVPEHLRRFCGDMDTKDRLIRRILYENKTR